MDALNPAAAHKRLGDGYYEQKLVNEQVARLTGYRRLDGYGSDEEQFKALMEAGITFARGQQLTPGIALSPEQVARLTADIVWLETQTLTLIDGSTVDVLAPKVYLTVKPGDINAHGGLISAGKLAMDGAGSIVNSGTLAGRKIVDLAATDITNSGVVQGGKVRLRGQDVNIEGGTVSADTLLAVEADRIRVASTTATGGDERNGQTQIDRVAGLYVNNTSDGLLSLKASESIDFAAADLRNEAAGGQTQIISDGRINIGTAKLSSHGKQGELGGKNHRHVSQTSEAGSIIGAKGGILISAKDDLTVRQSSIGSDEGRVTLSGRNVDIGEGRQTLDLSESVYSKSRGFASKKTSLDRYRSRHDEAVGSSIEGREVVIRAGQDVNVRGSHVVSDGRTVLKAGNDVNITAAENTYADHEFHERKRLGLSGGFKDGVLSVGAGKQQRSIDADVRKTTAALTGITALSGDTVISAGNRLRSEGASVSAARDILLQGKQVVLDAAYNAESETVHTQSKESGVRAGINLKAAEVRQLQKLAEGAKNAASESGAQNRLRAWDQGQLSSAAEPFMPAVNFSAGRSRSQSQDKLHTLTPVGSRVNAGGNVVIKATEGDVNIIGSQVYGAQNTRIDAFGDVGITEATGNIGRSAQGSSKTSGLMNGGSSFSLFAGNKTERSGEQSGRSSSVGSVVGSGSGDTVIRAGKTYTQSGSQLLADGNISVDAQKIDIRAAQSPYHSDFYSSQTQKGITAGFSSPVTDAVGSVQKLADSRAQVGQSSNGRTNAMAAANTGRQAYQAAQSIGKAADGKGAGINVNITYGEQRNESGSHIRGTESGASTVAAGGVVRLNAAGAGKDSDLTVIGSDVAGKGGTVLLAENNVNLLAAEQTHSERSSNSQRGWNAGVALDFSNGVSVGFTGGGNYGKGYGNGDEQTYRTTRIGDANSRTVIQSGGDTTLKGAQVKGRGVALSAENLRIESLQDSAAYDSRQFQGSGQITVGYGFSGSADYSQSKINAGHRSVNQQSGIFAGDGGFQVDVRNHTDLKGGIITSTETAEQNGRNRFQTATLSRSDIQNHSRFEGESFGLGVSGGMSGEALGQEQNGRLKNAADKDGMGSATGYGRDGDNRSSVTRSGIGTRNIVIGNDTDGTQAASVYTATRTETAEQNSGRLNNAFDREKVQSELDLQRSVSQDFGRNVSQIKGEINRKAEGYLKRAKIAEAEAVTAWQNGNMAAYRQAVQSADENRRRAGNWQKGGVALAAVATGLSAPTDSALGITAATAGPAAAYQIGQYFKGVAAQNSDGRLTGAQETARAVAHGVIAAAAAAAGDNNALTAAISAGGAEAAAPYVSQWLYGEKDGSKLTAEQKQTVSSILSLGGAAVGVTGGSTADTVAGGQAAQTAVENNFSLSDLGISQTAQNNLQQIAHQQVQQFVVNSNSSTTDKSKLFELLKAYNANAAITAEITAALGLGANLSVTINKDKSIVITTALTAGAGFEAFAGLSASNEARKDGAFAEVCSTIGGGIVLGGCAGAHLARNEPLVLTGKVGGGASAIANANIGYQWTINAPKSQGSKK
ncbi:hemagglutinin repeat-containing protein [Neisseria sp.]|uniref:hemagglutinin repeat-containing protein n=1 Tax=Neisseria sp. TaxID=192066 RepID=UPI0026DDA325|nr:hemagglutinin repeat-containing protein [Neisseria sp.]MDO4907526.1 hemagglutinin repeat-containing protein [Neisseria sp.]